MVKPGIIFSVFLVLFSSWLSTENSAVEGPSPNIIFILADDLGWADMGYQSNGRFRTPTIDRMKEKGFYFSHAYANAPVCAPSRACLLTGLYPPRHEIYNVNKSHAGPAYSWPLLTAPRNEDLDTSFFTLAEAFQAEGYRTGFIGKWHLWEDHPAFNPENHGFEEVFGGDPDGKVKSHFPKYGPVSLPHPPGSPYLADLLTDQAIKFIAPSVKQDNRPFFLLLSHYAVHDPIEAKPADIEPFKKTFTEKDSAYFNPVYAGMVKNLDDNIGRILDFLKAKQLDKETIIVFFSDNGGSLGYTTNLPLRSGKGTLYEGGIRVPLIFYSEGNWIPQGTSDLPVHSLDFFPTLASLTNSSIRTELDGNDLSTLIRTGKESTVDKDRPIYWVYPAQKRFRTRHKPSAVFEQTTFPAAAIRKGDLKLIHYFGLLPNELFDLSADVGETTNLAAKHPNLHDELLGNLQEWLKQTNAYIPVPNIDFDPEKSKSEGLWK